MKIGIIGKGNVDRALGAGLTRAGHEVKYGHRDPKESVEDATSCGEIVILAVPSGSVKDVAYKIGVLVSGKTPIDMTNWIGASGDLSVGFSTSGAEELQKMVPKAKVVKGTKTVFAQNLSMGSLNGQRLSAFIAGDDSQAKKTALKLFQDIGFDVVDCGPLRNTRYLEPMAMLIMEPAFDRSMGTKIGYKLLKA